MRIVFTGGGTGGHFYPIIAVAEKLNEMAEQKKLLEIKLYFFSDSEYDRASLIDNNIAFIQIPSGKRRVYRSIANITDTIKIGFGCIVALFRLFSIFPDVVFSKGGYASFPTLFAAKILGIPVVIHESDTIPGRVNLWAAKFAERIAVSYPQATEKFPEKVRSKIAWTGQPIRRELLNIDPSDSFSYFKFDPAIPTIFIQGGSSGSEKINDAILDILPYLLDRYQVIHQVGKKNTVEIEKRLALILRDSSHKERYTHIGLMGPVAIKKAAGCSSVIITRAGSFLFEIAVWGIPSIVIPIPESVSRDQRSNAYAYGGTGAAVVIEEANMTSSIIKSEIDRLIKDGPHRKAMAEAAKNFGQVNAANTIAEEILTITQNHER